MDLFALVVIAFVIIQFVAPILKAIATAVRGASQTIKTEPAHPPDQQAQGSSDEVRARAAQLEQLRRALLASAGVDQPASAASSTSMPAAAAPAAPPQLTRMPSQPTPLRVQPRRARVRPVSLQPVVITTAPVTVAADDMMGAPGSLMSLESATTAFEPLGAPSTSGTLALGPSAPVPQAAAPALSLLQGRDSGMNLFIAAAIIGPCAAFRPVSHTPGGW